MAGLISFTPSGFEDLKNEKDKLLAERIPAVENLRIAREMGDLSENGAYKAARAQLSSIDSRLRHLAKLIRFGRVENTPTSGEVGIGSVVSLMQNGHKIVYEIVGSFESNPALGKISHISPLGKALMGRISGNKINLATPNGISTYQILEVK